MHVPGKPVGVQSTSATNGSQGRVGHENTTDGFASPESLMHKEPSTATVEKPVVVNVGLEMHQW